MCTHSGKSLSTPANQVSRSFSFGTPYISAVYIEAARKQELLEAGHVWFSILQAKVSVVKASCKPYFFGPLVLDDIRAGWEYLYSQENQERAEDIFASDFLIFPTDEQDHWLLIIASNFKDLRNGGESAVYVLDSKGNRLYRSPWRYGWGPM